jgi:chromosome segregation ATPase
MDFSDDRDFNCTFDHHDQNEEFAGELLEKRMDGLAWKITLLAVALPCLVAVVVGLAYYRLSSRVADFQHTGSSAVQEVSQAVEGKVAALQQKASSQDETLAAINQKLGGIDQNAGAIKNIQSSLKGLQISVAAHQDGLTAQQDGLKSLRDDIKSLTAAGGKTAASLQALGQDLEKLLLTVAENSRQQLTLRQQLEGLDMRLKGLTAEKVDIGTLSQTVADLEKKWRDDLAASTGALAGDLKRLEGQIAEIRRQIAALSRPAPQTGSPSPSAPPSGIREETL